MTSHVWRYLYCHPHNGEYLFECIHCKDTDYISRSDYLAGLKPNPTNSLCLGKIEEAKEETPQVLECDYNRDTSISFDNFVDVLYRAGWRSVCDAQHTELEKLWRKLFQQNQAELSRNTRGSQNET